jgi:hypothetical protein
MTFNHVVYFNELVQGVCGRHGNLPYDQGGEGYRTLPLLAHPQQHSGLRCEQIPPLKGRPPMSFVLTSTVCSCSSNASQGLLFPIWSKNVKNYGQVPIPYLRILKEGYRYEPFQSCFLFCLESVTHFLV